MIDVITASVCAEEIKIVMVDHDVEGVNYYRVSCCRFELFLLVIAVEYERYLCTLVDRILYRIDVFGEMVIALVSAVNSLGIEFDLFAVPERIVPSVSQVLC